MTVFDYVFFAVLALSVLLGAWRGLVAEVFALAGWVLALVLAWKSAEFLTPYLGAVAAAHWARWGIAFLLVFVLTLIVMALARALMAELLKAAGLGLSDRALGAVFGTLRGLIIALVVVLLAGLTEVPSQPWWRGAVSAPPLEGMVIALKPRMPEDLAKRLSYR